MGKSRRYNHKDLLKFLKKHNIIEIEKRGKGSERMLYNLKTKESMPIKYHGKKTEYGKGFLSTVKRRFNLPDDFLNT